MSFESERHLAEFVRSQGGQLWSVGGAVRDELMGRPAHDRDYVVTGLDVGALPFEKVTGHDFPVFQVRVAGQTCEVALARKEKKIGKGYHGFTFFSDPGVTIGEDLARRDLTINAMAKSVLTGEWADPFQGRRDLENGILRHPTPAFCEDPLRVYRVARFAAKFGFSIAPETMELMAAMKADLESLKAERIWKELEKVLEHTNPGRFFRVLDEAGVLDVHFREVAALHVPDKHDGTAFNHTMRVMNGGESALDRFALLVHDFGKGRTPAEGHPAHPGHDKLGAEAVAAFCKRLKIPKSFETFGLLCAAEHMRAKRAPEMRAGTFVAWVQSLKTMVDGVLRVSFTDSSLCEGADLEEETKMYHRALDLVRIVRDVESQVTGDALLQEGKQPGPQFGQILFQRRVEAFKRLTAPG
jgi:tRNA nucleotidyltransferase (CCA-adding enzyme)